MGLLDDLPELKEAIADAFKAAMEDLFVLPEGLSEADQNAIKANWAKLGSAVADGTAEPILQHIVDHGGTGGGTPGIGGGPPYFEIPLKFTAVMHGDGLQIASGQFSFDAGAYDGFDFKLQAVAWAAGTTGVTARIRLRNVTADEYVTGADLTTTANSATTLTSAALTVGIAAGNLRSVAAIYELRLDVENGVRLDDMALFGSACLRLEV